ncbi:MAG: hypothetical protein M3160_10085 [Candidatus Eremiobacteraeota bacterium]|nr:hypothetical protein [Candidatus Eremiobacteraeota bacterium]
MARAILVAISLMVAVTYYPPFGKVDFFGNWGGGTLGFSTDRLAMGSVTNYSVSPCTARTPTVPTSIPMNYRCLSR